MERPKVLLLNLSSSNDLILELQRIFEKCSNPSLDLQSGPLSLKGENFHNGNLARLITKNTTDMIFLVFDSAPKYEATVLVKNIKLENPEMPILAFFERGTPERIIELLQMGVDDFITLPSKILDVAPRVLRLLGGDKKKDDIVENLKGNLGLRQIIGQSSSFLEELKKIPHVAKCDARVLISGESGTGKELFARAIHYLSPRSDKPFIPVNCGAIPTDLVENELFGHERGAYTGASSTHCGLMEEADGGTVVLDEVDCLPLKSQVKLLRFLQEGEFRPLGSSKERKSDIRVIAATNIDLQAAVKEGKFRRDLYYRLNVIPFELPPLRERQDDIPLLARHFLDSFSTRFKKNVRGISPDAMQKLIQYEWPGNVRELENAIERAVVLNKGEVLRSDDILPEVGSSLSEVPFQEAKSRYVARFEKSYILRLLRAYGGNITKAADGAKTNRRSFWRLMKKHGIDAERFRSENS